MSMYDWAKEPDTRGMVCLTADMAKAIQGLLRQAKPHLPFVRAVEDALQALEPRRCGGVSDGSFTRPASGEILEQAKEPKDQG